eukprot:CAMPEP_0116996486 /NCGR_PEP_ID=MMETSP0472-20121206/272_1 /TAXON_ID=693140 ORGANISM="Tiarina fusus, Strain LIS" /NCGR_SAMPLE_ID=MMETSP0472 /ASSEMBLY_ACC=CAM_ASM_000603 /LENGTH=131 /DNA_ID=CAMNT_0004695115 /DNA_START=313 /DNA_END=708 /DNA_ORIENTATION=-
MVFGKKGSKEYSKVSLDDFSDDSSNGGDDFVESGIRTQQELLRKQDEGLDMLSASVERLGQMSMGISEELGHQNNMLEAMETDLDEAGDDLDMVTRKTKEFIKMSGGERNCMVIVALSLIALVLFFLILYV